MVVRSWIQGVGFALLSGLITVPAYAQTDLIPDLVVDEARLSDYEYTNTVIPGRVHMRLTNAVGNIGLGPLVIFPVEGNEETFRQPIFQRIRVDVNGDGDGIDPGDSFFDRAAGDFVFHPAHNHFHVDRWSNFRIRAVLPGNGVGNILRKGNKTGFCLLDSATYTAQPPVGLPAAFKEFQLCGTSIQGISVGWEDIYFKDLPDQWIDITGILPGEYWLESVVDPDNVMLELDDTNNVARIKFTILPGELPDPIPVPLNTRLPFIETGIVLLLGLFMLRSRASAHTRG